MLRSLVSGLPVSVPEDFTPEPERTICITGHRAKYITPLNGDSSLLPLTVKCVYLMLCRYIDLAAAAGYDTFMDGLATGTDLWAARHIVNRKKSGQALRLNGVMPFLRHADRISGSERELLRDVELNCDDLICTSSDPFIVYSGTGPGKNLYRTRNYFMSDCSSAAIAFLDDDKRRSGTGQTVAYLTSQGKPAAVFGNSDIHRLMLESGGEQAAFEELLGAIPDPFR